MSASINYRLQQLANEYYISRSSLEAQKIDASVSTLIARIRKHFGTDINNVAEFGSYKRDTILPRNYDEYSDVDLMIVFNHASLNVNPSTYRNYLVAFCKSWYQNSLIYKSSPTVVLELGHIKYDLVPTYVEEGFFTSLKTYYIPESDVSWMETDPYGFNTELTSVNTSNDYNIKKVIRLLKAWNSKVGYPIASYKLEQEIARGSYYYCSTIEEYFFKAVDNISSYRNGIFYSPNQKVVSLKENAERVKTYLQSDNITGAMTWLAHILPI